MSCRSTHVRKYFRKRHRKRTQLRPDDGESIQEKTACLSNILFKEAIVPSSSQESIHCRSSIFAAGRPSGHVYRRGLKQAVGKHLRQECSNGTENIFCNQWKSDACNSAACVAWTVFFADEGSLQQLLHRCGRMYPLGEQSFWWTVQDLNLWHLPCKGSALPTELTVRQDFFH